MKQSRSLHLDWIFAAFTDLKHNVDNVGQCHILSDLPDGYMDWDII